MSSAVGVSGGEVEVPRAGLTDISRALTKKRLDLVKVSSSLNEAPKGMSDLLLQSRTFTEKLSYFLEDGSDLSELVKQTLLEDKGFPGQVYRLPLEQMFTEIESIKEELRLADGYQPYLVAPEKGLRNLLTKALSMLIHPVNDLVDNIHGIVNEASARALTESCQVPGIGAHAPPVTRFPNFIESIMPVISTGLLDLKEEAREMAIKVVDMEKSFISCSFFRYMTYKRLNEATSMTTTNTINKTTKKDKSRFKLRPGKKERNKNHQEKKGKKKGKKNVESSEEELSEEDLSEEDMQEGEISDDNYTEVSSSIPFSKSESTNAYMYDNVDGGFGLSGYLQKSSTHSRNKVLRAESTLWQKRFFGVREEMKMMEYYNSEENYLKGQHPKGCIDLMDVIIEDTEGSDQLPNSSLSKYIEHLDKDIKVSTLFLIRCKDPEKSIFKDSKDLILRAENVAEKYRWFSYLKSVANDKLNDVNTISTSSMNNNYNNSYNENDSSFIYIQDDKDKMKGKDSDAFKFTTSDIINRGLGLGSDVFWSNICRDNNNKLLPSPGVILEDTNATFDTDIALQQHMKDMKFYTQMVCETLILTIPKVIIYCLVDKATDDLGHKIEEYILNLSDESKNQLLSEDPGLSIYRDKIKKLILDIGDSEEKIKNIQRNIISNSTSTSSDNNSNLIQNNENVQLPFTIIELAGLTGRLSKTPNASGRYVFTVKPPQAHRSPNTQDTAPTPPSSASSSPTPPSSSTNSKHAELQNSNQLPKQNNTSMTSSSYENRNPNGGGVNTGSSTLLSSSSTNHHQNYNGRNPISTSSNLNANATMTANTQQHQQSVQKIVPKRQAPKLTTSGGRPLSPSPLTNNPNPGNATSSSSSHQTSQSKNTNQQSPQNWYTWKPFQK